PGDAINSDRIVAERANLDAALGETGYAYAKVGEPDLLIDHERREGDLTVPVTPGGVYRFGQIVSSREGFLSSRHLDRIARFDSGDTYKRSEVDDLRQAILATGLVSSVTVATRETSKPAAGAPGTVDVDVTLTPAPLRTIAGLIGYSSGEGFRVEAQWEHRNIFPPEGMLRLRGVAGTQEQLAGVTFRRNNFIKRDLVLNADLYARNQVSSAFEARTISLTAGLERQTTLLFQKPWIFAGGIEILATGERDASAIRASEGRTTYFIGALPMRIAYDGSDSLLDPTSGFRLGLRVSPEISVQNGMKSSYGKAQLDASYYQRAGDSVVVAGRVRLGTIMGAPIDNIAPSRRFYAGGGGSVRGYGFQQIGPRDALNEPSGGRALTEFSLEARVKTGLMGGAVSVVPFVDAGAVDTTTTPSFEDLKIGVGVGIRYQTNFGPIRIDVGTPLNPSPGDSRIGVYVALGQAF
ncbi:MAG: outer membrane protein assembly factor, partial [Novosphingobium sp.]|nr:outer membrane protein assembly factor [Novosphingobium sp.]